MTTLTKKTPFFYGYTIIAAGFFLQAVAWGTCNSFGIFFRPLINEFGWSRAAVSGAVSLGFILSGSASILIGSLNDKLGPRIIMTACGLFLGLGFILLGTLNSLWQLYLFYGLISGLGLGGMDVIPLSTVSRWFQKQRGMMSGIVKVGTGIGMFAMPFFINRLLADYGWRNSFMILGLFIVTSVLLLAQFLVRDPVLKNQYVDNDIPSAPVSHGGPEAGLTFKQAVRTRLLWTICMVYFVILFCVYTILMHIVQHAIDLDIRPGVAAGILSTIGGTSIAGRLVIGWSCDKIGEKFALLVCLLLLLVSLFWLQLVQSLWMFYLFATVYGFAHGGFFSMISPLVAKFFGTRAHGLLLGIVIFCSTAGGSTGPLLAGYVFDVTGSYKMVFWCLAAFCTAAVVLTTSIKPIVKS